MKFCNSCNKTKDNRDFKTFKNGKKSKTCKFCLSKVVRKRSVKIKGKNKGNKITKYLNNNNYPKPRSIFYYFREHFRKVFSEKHKDLSPKEIDDYIIEYWHDPENDLHEFFYLVAYKHTQNYYKSKMLIEKK